MSLNEVIIKVFLLFCVSQVYAELKLYDECFHNVYNKKGVCVLLNDCAAAKKWLNKGNLPQTCGFDEGFHPIVCCPQENKIIKNISNKKCDEYVSNLVDLTPILDDGRIIGGQNASKGEYPHMAALGYGEYPDIQWLCGGALISEYFILTAAHCLISGDREKVSYVQLGDNILHKQNFDDNMYEVAEYFKHENYKAPFKYNDIALLKLNRKVVFTSYIKPACLYTETNFEEMKLVEATGWGQNGGPGTQTDVLQKVEMDIFDQDVCRESYASVGPRFLPTGIKDTQFCAGSLTKISDTCPGDSGGPLQFLNYHKGIHCIIGITSFGKTCGIKNPGVYTRISSFVPWIENIVWNAQNDI